MSMTENEAIKEIERHIQYLRESWKPHPDYNVIEALKEAIYALDKLEQYRAIGSVEGYKRAIEVSKENYYLYLEYKAKLQAFEAIGTVEEFKDLKEKEKRKAGVMCPICGKTGTNICEKCGQDLTI